MRKWMLALLGVLALFISAPALAEDLNSDGYCDADVEGINRLIDSNGLNWEKDKPESWSGVTWYDVGGEKYVRTLQLSTEEDGASGEVDLRGFAELRELECTGAEISAIQVSGSGNLTKLLCYSSGISALDLSGLTNLTNLECDRNANLHALDLSPVPNLGHLLCSNTGISSLNLAAVSDLLELDCSNTAITSLNLAAVPKLQTLYCNDTGVSSLNLAAVPDLEWLACKNTELHGTMDVSHLRNNLRSLEISGTNISKLSIGNAPNLSTLDCAGTDISALDINQLPRLQYLDCAGTGVKTLDLSVKPELYYLDCSNTPLASLDVTALSGLKTLRCANTNIFTLDLRGKFALQSLDVTGNAFDTFISPEGHTLTIQKTGNGSGSILLRGYAIDDGFFELEAIPDAGSHFDDWTLPSTDDGYFTKTGELKYSCQIDLKKDRTLEATFLKAGAQIEPDGAVAPRGGKLQLTASLHNSQQGTTPSLPQQWRILYGSEAGSSIDNSGLLTVPADETAEKLRIRVTVYSLDGGSQTAETVVTVASVTNGDVNGDGHVNLSDAVFTARGITGFFALDPYATAAADANRDGRVNVADVLKLCRYLVDNVTLD